MKALRLLLVTLLVASCGGEILPGGPSTDTGLAPAGDSTGGDPFAPCIDPVKCCSAADTVCWGDPDKGTICKCTGLWDCSKNPDKCEQDKPVPPGGGSWTCTWQELSYVCKGAKAPPAGGGWKCVYNPAEGKWVCTHTPPNPTNKPGGTSVWKCTVDNELNKITCQKGTTKPDAGAPPPPPPPPKKEQNCADGVDNDGDGLVDCKDPDCNCQPPACPSGTECCDGIDNDGDGKIDEGNVCGGIPEGQPCPPGAFQACDCYCGVHRKCKADGTWGPCLVDYSCAPAQITAHSQCGPNQVCDFGKCVSGGYGAGQCVHHNDCKNGLVCDLGYCVTDNYKPWKCP